MNIDLQGKVQDTVTLEHTGFMIKGNARIKMWGGNEGDVYMKPTYVEGKELTSEDLKSAINDGGFGCERILSADCLISAFYQDFFGTYERDIKWVHVTFSKDEKIEKIEDTNI